jgi:hypothetical protein
LKYTDIEKGLPQQIILLINSIINHNYFQYNNILYKPNKGVAMGSPISGKIAEIFLQHYEQLILKHIQETKAIVYYNRYVDDTLIIVNSTITSEEQITKMMNTMHSNLLFTPT